MPHDSRLVRLSIFACILGAALLAGCGKEKIQITRYPRFYDTNLRTVAVLPFENASDTRGAGAAVASAVADDLARQGIYNVVAPADLDSVADAKTVAAGTDAVIGQLRSRGQVQAVVVGMVTQYGLTRRGPNPSDEVAVVDASARLVRVIDGGTMQQAGPSVARTPVHPLDGSDAAAAREQAMGDAVRQCAAGLVRPFGPMTHEVKIPKNGLFTASELRGKKWRKEGKFRVTDKEVIVVVKLPDDCDRSVFRVAIYDKITGRDVASEDLMWFGEWSSGPGEGFPFPMSEILAKAGAGKFEARLYSNGKAVLKKGFQIEPPKRRRDDD